MHLFFSLWLLGSTALALPQQAPLKRSNSTWVPGPTDGSDKLAEKGMTKLKSYLSSQNSSSTCTLDNAIRRKEWDSLCDDEKREYIQAVRCLQTRPSISGDLVPGARNRYDDFVATHVNQTLRIHSTGSKAPHLPSSMLSLTSSRLPHMASILCPHLRACSARRMRLFGLPTIHQLGPPVEQCD